MKHKTTYSLKKESCCCKKEKDVDDNCCKNKKVTICKSLDNYKQSNVLEIHKLIVFADIIPLQTPFNTPVIAIGNVTETMLVVKPPGRTVKRNILYRQFLI